MNWVTCMLGLQINLCLFALVVLVIFSVHGYSALLMIEEEQLHTLAVMLIFYYWSECNCVTHLFIWFLPHPSRQCLLVWCNSTIGSTGRTVKETCSPHRLTCSLKVCCTRLQGVRKGTVVQVEIYSCVIGYFLFIDTDVIDAGGKWLQKIYFPRKSVSYTHLTLPTKA